MRRGRVFRLREGKAPVEARGVGRGVDVGREGEGRVGRGCVGVAVALPPRGPLGEGGGDGWGEEGGTALRDLRSALPQSRGASPKPTATTLAAELERLEDV